MLERIDIKWAAFHVLEIMSSNKPIHKRLAFLLASLIMKNNAEMITLSTNLLKKVINLIYVHKSNRS